MDIKRPVGRRALRQRVESLQRAGVRFIGAGQARQAGTPPAQADQRDELLRELAREVAGCTRCAELAGTRNQTVFGVGNPQAELCFVGEAPGAEEDKQGEPFVGAAGQLLDRILGAMGLDRKQVYICNVLKCRPPGNRQPAPDEVGHCSDFLDRQLAAIQPRFICALGLVAARRLLGVESSMARLRGKFHDYQGIPVLCTYHPAYLLRNPPAKKDVWEDMQMLMREMGLPIPQSG